MMTSPNPGGARERRTESKRTVVEHKAELVSAIDALLSGIERGRTGSGTDLAQLTLDARAVMGCLRKITGAKFSEGDAVFHCMAVLPQLPLLDLTKSLSAAAEFGAEGLLISRGQGVPSRIAKDPGAMQQFLEYDVNVRSLVQDLRSLKAAAAPSSSST